MFHSRAAVTKLYSADEVILVLIILSLLNAKFHLSDGNKLCTFFCWDLL
jgi:hypothetical protein